MVTHNYEQAEPYVTRKIRLHDGEVVADVRVNDVLEKEKTDTTPESIIKSETEAKKTELSKQHSFQRHVAEKFASMNHKTQLGRAFLFRIFFLITAATSFIFIGQLFKNADDTSTKDYNKEIFYQKNDSRLSVRHIDGTEITANDIKEIQSVRNVVAVDQYDYVNDINYYCEEGKDYHFTYGLDSDDPYGSYVMSNGEFYFEEEEVSEIPSDKSVVFDKKNKFMKSATCISENSLAAGRMPEKRLEIVLYSNDKNLLNKEKEIYFTAENIMGEQNYYHNKFTVVGLLKEKASRLSVSAIKESPISI